MKFRFSIILFISLLYVSHVSAYFPPDLKPYFLKLTLSSDFHEYHQNQVIQFNLNFKNSDQTRHTIILPGNQNRGNKMVYFSYYTVDENNHYSEVARESREISMDTSGFNQPFFKNLEAGDSTNIPIFLNDSANYRDHIPAHHRLPDLQPGDYKVLAWYDPMDQEWAPKIFNEVSGFSKSDSLSPGQQKFNIPEGGLMSNYFDLTILPGKGDKIKFYRSVKCDKTCDYCKAIEAGKWKKVKRIIDRQTYYKGEGEETPIDTTWLGDHCNVAFVYPGPDAILSSLPTSTYRRIIFRNQDGYYYFAATWQLGIVYRIRSRAWSILNWIAPFPIDIKTSEVDYQKLVGFERY